MSKVRLYHLAREWDVSASDIIETLAERGRKLPRQSHFVELDSTEVPEIKAILTEAGLFGRPAAAVAVAEPPRPEPVKAPEPAPKAVEKAPAKTDGARAPEKVEPAKAVPVAEKAEPAKAAAPAPARSAPATTAPAATPAAPAAAAPARPDAQKAPAPAAAAAHAPAAPVAGAPKAPAAPAGAAPTGAAPAARPAGPGAPGVRPAAGPGGPRPMGPGPGGPRPMGPGAGPGGPRPMGPGGPRPMGPGAGPGGPRPMGPGGPRPAGAPGQPQQAPGRPGEPARVAAQGPGAPGAPPSGAPRTGPFVPAHDPDFRPGRIVRRADPVPPQPARFGGPPGARPGMAPGGPRGPGGPPGRFGPPGTFGRGPGGRTDYAVPEQRARTDIPVTPNLRGDEESRRRSRFGPAAPGARPRGPGAPGEPGTGEGEGMSRTAVSPAKKGKQATRRAGPGGSMGAGRRMDKRMHERDRWKRASSKRKRTVKVGPINRPTECTIDLPISIKDLSAKFAVRVADIMQILMTPPHNLMLNLNAPVPSEAVQVLADHFKIAVEINEEVDVDDATVKELEEVETEDKEEDLLPRQPVVAVLGHVDHGKTSLLDRIRQTKVAEGEEGGITQHTGAYVAVHDGKPLTFLDTPGHEAFTAMRARGANVTDIVLLVVAADDGVMPQTKEAIAHAKAADAVIVVALNKIDKPNANPAKVMQQLAGEGLNPVEWGGEIEVIPVSALTGEGIDKLLETLLLTAEIMELKANPNRPAKGTVLEAKKTEGRGIVASVLVENGTLKRGDYILCGRSYDKARMLFSDRQKPVKEAGPGVPVEVIGLAEIPAPGDRFYVMEDEKKAREIIEQRTDELRLETVQKRAGVSAENIWEQLGKAEVNEVRLILKTDVTGSLEVLKAEIEKLSQKSSEVRLRLLHAAVGTITPSDVILAEASKPCFVIGFTVNTDSEAGALAREKNIEIRTYKIIYELLDDLQKIMSGELTPVEKEVVLGTLLIRQVFKSSKVGMIAGSVVEKGIAKRSGKARLVRDGVVIWEGDIEGLKRFKEDVKEVKEGFECGVKLKGYDEVKEGDKIEVYEIQKVARSL